MRILLSEKELRRGVERLAGTITEHYGSRPVTVVAVMTGAIILLADLIRNLDMPLRVGVIGASSYRGGTESGELTVDTQMLIDIRGRDILLIDDIFDTGKTLNSLVEEVRRMGANSVKTAVLLHKRRSTDVQLTPDFVAFEIPDEFVVGYGLDYQDHYRNLPYLAILDAEDISQTEKAASHAVNCRSDG